MLFFAPVGGIEPPKNHSGYYQKLDKFNEIGSHLSDSSLRL